MNLFASVKPDAPTPLPLLSHLPPLDGDEASQSITRPPAPLTCGSCSGLSSSQQSIIDDAIAQVLGPGVAMDSLVQPVPAAAAATVPASAPAPPQAVEEAIAQVAQEAIDSAAQAAYREVCADIAAEVLSTRQPGTMEAKVDEVPEVDGEQVEVEMERDENCIEVDEDTFYVEVCVDDEEREGATATGGSLPSAAEDALRQAPRSDPPFRQPDARPLTSRQYAIRDQCDVQATRVEETSAHGVDATSTQAKGPPFNRPCGRGPVGKEWDTSIGKWVSAGKSKGEAWVAWRDGDSRAKAHPGCARPKPAEQRLRGRHDTSSAGGGGDKRARIVKDDDEEVQEEGKDLVEAAACREAISALASYVVSYGGTERMVRGWHAVRSRRSEGIRAGEIDVSFRRPAGAGGGKGKEKSFFRSRLEVVRFLGLQSNGTQALIQRRATPAHHEVSSSCSPSSSPKTTTAKGTESRSDARMLPAGGEQPIMHQLERAIAAPSLPSEAALARAAEIGRRAAMAVMASRRVVQKL